ncbi:MAG TPA: FUSC family protein [Streptomyces sp.]|nr:FUSC family protein [Streptomyces sp.]
MARVGSQQALSWLHALRDTARAGLRVERARLTPFLAVRGACGVAIVIGCALWLGTPNLAVAAAFGAFAAGIATFQRSWRPRPVLALGAAAGLALSTFVGYLVVGHTVAFVALIAAWAFMAGMAWALGPTTGVVAALTVAVMLIAVTLPTSVLGALAHAALIAAGGVVQAGLIVLFPVSPWRARRNALADGLAGVADYARRLRHDPDAAFDPQPLMEARSAAAVTTRQARRRPRQLRGYRALAERFRPVLASLADPVVGGVPEEGPQRERVRDLLAAAATVLDATARAIRRGEAVRIPEESLKILQVPESGPVLDSGPARKTAMRLIALTDDTVEAAQEPVEVTRRVPGLPPRTLRQRDADAGDAGAGDRPHHLHRPSVPGLLPLAVRALRRELTWSSPVLRHAVRLAAVVAVGRTLAELLPQQHGYWAPLTALMVMRPDFAQTYQRGVARLAGTLVGVTLAGTLVALDHPGQWLSAGLAVAAVCLMYLLLRTGYSIVSGCTAAYVVFLLDIAGSRWQQTVAERAWLTALGGLLAMLGYALYPTWETPRLRDRLAEWLEATGRYAVAVLDAFARPADRRPRQVRDALLDVRSARQEWERALTRAGAEPVRHRGLSRRSTREAQLALVTMGRVTMLMEAHLPPRDAEPSAGSARFTAVLGPAVSQAAAAVRDRRPLDFSAPRDALADWRSTCEAEDAEPVALRGSDLLTDALEELAAAVHPRAAAQDSAEGSANRP